MKAIRVYQNGTVENVVGVPGKGTSLTILDTAHGNLINHAEINKDENGVLGTSNDVEVDINPSGDITGFITAGLDISPIDCPPRRDGQDQGCKRVGGHISKISPNLSGVVWNTRFNNFHGGVGPYAGSVTTDLGEAVILTECWGLQKVLDSGSNRLGWVAACGQGIENCDSVGGSTATKCNADKRKDWRGTPVAVHNNGTMDWYRMDNFNGNPVLSSAFEYAVTYPGGISMVSDETMGFGVANYKFPTNSPTTTQPPSTTGPPSSGDSSGDHSGDHSGDSSGGSSGDSSGDSATTTPVHSTTTPPRTTTTNGSTSETTTNNPTVSSTTSTTGTSMNTSTARPTGNTPTTTSMQTSSHHSSTMQSTTHTSGHSTSGSISTTSFTGSSTAPQSTSGSQSTSPQSTSGPSSTTPLSSSTSTTVNHSSTTSFTGSTTTASIQTSRPSNFSSTVSTTKSFSSTTTAHTSQTEHTSPGASTPTSTTSQASTTPQSTTVQSTTTTAFDAQSVCAGFNDDNIYWVGNSAKHQMRSADSRLMMINLLDRKIGWDEKIREGKYTGFGIFARKYCGGDFIQKVQDGLVTFGLYDTVENMNLGNGTFLRDDGSQG